ncbi:hypothetical protein RSOLAG22IIIB_06106 [Rhizoctonia solani]|uniref:Uncharacterized protein n=1 Tax=Rhizoctonia solani TaxID=456999 RepID=A0A0K6GBW7_9AGAM|nr:hypothetical protein RSOLAG22IIIB_06106 [Rhizoctonia solani]
MVEDKPNKLVENAESIPVTLTLEPLAVNPMSLKEKKASRKRSEGLRYRLFYLPPDSDETQCHGFSTAKARAKIEEAVEPGMVWLDGSGPHANANELKAKCGAIEVKGTCIQRRHKKVETGPRALKDLQCLSRKSSPLRPE